MDCQMPIMDGYATTRALRQLPQFADLPVIAMTANAMVGDRAKALAAGMNDHVAKPINVEELFATIARWVHPAAQAGSAPTPRAFTDAAPLTAEPLPGIDMSIGHANTKGDERLYRRLLDLFSASQRDFEGLFRAARTSGDPDAAMRLAHDLKALAATIGAHAVQPAAASLERACVELADDATVEALLQTTGRELEIVIGGLQARRDEAASGTAAATDP
jgi:HPt (histidine-containing phosphotransfer) domain-containing protein